ncbi:hypothetical protein [Massilia yuzhufengensis]|uniref:Uncharacterized protein n=1 Tax=Massilia yuzhufengensis TaxID=1164594 RepID=A0A1I1WIP4_9BURK|nr:hypothetical protein [Massilia yuzhufengensis]SFD94962.1 hypothetical protein SAMN05216204_14816 [Massilia yuzhufengensis]
MKSKDKGLGGDKRSRGPHKPKTVSVAEGSLQSRAPGAVMRGGPDTLFPTANTGSQQSDRSRAGATTNGWSARQRGERMQARAEQNRQGESRQSGAGTKQNAS